MARYSKISKLDPDAVLQAALAFFGAGGLGLDVIEQVNRPGESSAVFKGSGHVFIQARKKNDGSEVELDTDLNNQQVSELLEKL